MDIGRYEFISSGSRFVFFSLGRTIAFLRQSGKIPSESDRLHIFAIVSARSGIRRLMSHVGAGSIAQCFAGELPMIFEISSADTGLKSDNNEQDLL